MNYIGSKHSLLEFIYSVVEKEQIQGKVLLDLFAGTHSVGRFFKNKGYQVIGNDWQYYSFVLGNAYIVNNEIPLFRGLEENIPKISTNSYMNILNYLNHIPGEEGFIYHNYSLEGTKNQTYERMYFSGENAKKCDAIRQCIQHWFNKEKITQNEYYILLATLLENVDAVANTASVYGAFLKKYKKSALKPLYLKPIDIYESFHEHRVFREDAKDLVAGFKPDILYLDPPYNTRQYCANYHILETIAAYDNPIIKGKTGVRCMDNKKSLFCKKLKVEDAFIELMQRVNAPHIFLSYNTEGLMRTAFIEEILSAKGTLKKRTIVHKRFRADNYMNRNYKVRTDQVKEILYYVKS